MAERLTLIDYGSGNLRSAAKALERAAREANRPVTVTVSGAVADVDAADRIVLPGVGAFGQCAGALRAIDGMEAALHTAVHARGRPFLGICVGMQLMAREGHEHGRHAGLGWIDGAVEPLAPAEPSLKIPHMGWNRLDWDAAADVHPVTAGLPRDAHAYFVHSFHMVPADPAHILARADYAGPVTAIVAEGTAIGTQFHPEKSQALGLAFLRAFLEWRP